MRRLIVALVVVAAVLAGLIAIGVSRDSAPPLQPTESPTPGGFVLSGKP
jgi:hypothetical protein